MQVRSPTRQSVARIGLEPEVNPGAGRNEPNQLGGRRAFTATDTGAYRADHRKVYLSYVPGAYPVS
jgi:hypothetical protein